jgi:hypothetical protein
MLAREPELFPQLGDFKGSRCKPKKSRHRPDKARKRGNIRKTAENKTVPQMVSSSRAKAARSVLALW